jgi:uncharacterized protein (DUF885 family)
MRPFLPLCLCLLASAAPVAAQAPQSPHDTLFALFARSNEDMLRRHPTAALSRGDLRYADRLGDPFSDANDAADLAADRRDLAELHAIDRAALDPTDRIAYDVFETSTARELKAMTDPELRLIYRVQPINHFYGFHLGYADMASGQGVAPFKTLADFENNLKRNRQFAPAIDRIIARFREGLKVGIVESKLTVRNMIDQLTLQIDAGVDKSTYLGPLAHVPDTVGEADRARLRNAYRADVRDDILPALTRLRDFLKNDYLPHARDGVGLKNMKGGAKEYAFDIEQGTTLPLTADYVHNLGLSEVARIKGEMQAAAKRAGFAGTLPELFTYMRTAKRFQPASAEALRDGFVAIRARVEKRIPEQFSTIPKTPLEIRPDPPYKEKTSAGGEYHPGTPDGSRPGIFYYNSYDLPSRYTWEMETLFLHEGEPGHHFQISLAQENKALPAFMRFGGDNAFVEGWALYAESLGPSLGMETDPWQRLGQLNDEMLRAMRLVVDTGIHADGWNREQAIKYMLDNSPMSPTDAIAEVERYIAIPGQALGYKIGQLTIQRLRAKAEAALGPRFDIRAFHAQVLMTGSLPLPVVEHKIDNWIASQKG